MDYNRHRKQEPNYSGEPSEPLKRVSIESEVPIEKLQRHEIGIKSDLKGSEIKQYVDNAIYKLVYLKMPSVTLKAIGTIQLKKLNYYIFKVMRARKFFQFPIFFQER
jgi:hypothetical protein